MDEYSMKWYKFIIYVQLFLSALLSVGSAASYITGAQYQGNADAVYATFSGMKTLDMFMGIANIVIAVFSIVVRQKLANFKKEGPSWYLILFGASAAVTLIYLIVGTNITGINLIDSSSVTSIVMSAVLIAINKSYFDKRKELFVN